MSFTISFLRQYSENSEKTFMGRCIDSALCGALSFATHFGIVAAGGDPGWSVFVGGSIGYFGPDAVKAFVTRFLNSKIK